MPRPKQFDPETALLKAMELFWKCGYNATSMEDLVQVMRVNRASLYATYGDKHQLFLKALECYRQKTLRPQIHHMCHSGDILGYLENLLRPVSLQEPCAENSPSSLGCFVANCVTELGTSDPDIVKLSHEILAEIRREIRLGIEREMKTGSWNLRANAEEIAGLIFTLLMGVRVLHRSGVELNWARESIAFLRAIFKNTRKS